MQKKKICIEKLVREVKNVYLSREQIKVRKMKDEKYSRDEYCPIGGMSMMDMVERYAPEEYQPTVIDEAYIMREWAEHIGKEVKDFTEEDKKRAWDNYEKVCLIPDGLTLSRER